MRSATGLSASAASISLASAASSPRPSGINRGGQGLAIDLVEALLDDLERQEVLLLLVQDAAQPLDVAVVELAVPRRRALGVDEALALEEADLRDRDVGELVAELVEHLADRRVRRARPRSAAPGSPPSDEAQAVAPDLDLVAVVQRRRVDALPVHVGAVERTDVAHHVAVVGRGRCTTWRRDTVMSSRKMSESGWRPTSVCSASSRNDEPAFGPCRTTSSPTPGGQLVEVVARARPRASAASTAGSVRVVSSARRRAGAPHDEQNRRRGWFACPQRAHTTRSGYRRR